MPSQTKCGIEDTSAHNPAASLLEPEEIYGTGSVVWPGLPNLISDWHVTLEVSGGLSGPPYYPWTRGSSLMESE